MVHGLRNIDDRPVPAEKSRVIGAKESARIAELEAALRHLLMYADLSPYVEGVVYPCGTHRDVINRARALLEPQLRQEFYSDGSPSRTLIED